MTQSQSGVTKLRSQINDLCRELGGLTKISLRLGYGSSTISTILYRGNGPAMRQLISQLLEYKRLRDAEWICSICGTKWGTKIPELVTFHHDTCGVCGFSADVTEKRDYGIRI